jgi:hypothetical protein
MQSDIRTSIALIIVESCRVDVNVRRVVKKQKAVTVEKKKNFLHFFKKHRKNFLRIKGWFSLKTCLQNSIEKL